MPIIKSAIKRMRQNKVQRTSNKHYRSHMKSMIKLILEYVDKGDMEKAKKILPEVVSAIDTAAKKNILHDNNAARKKSRVQRVINAGPKVKKEKVEKAPKEEAKKEDKKVEKKGAKKK